VVFLKRSAWNAVDGETLPTTFMALPGGLLAVAEIEQGGQALVVAEYEDWKARVLRRQHRDEKQE